METVFLPKLKLKFVVAMDAARLVTLGMSGQTQHTISALRWDAILT